MPICTEWQHSDCPVAYYPFVAINTSILDGDTRGSLLILWEEAVESAHFVKLCGESFASVYSA